MHNSQQINPRVVAVGESLIDMILQVDGAYKPVPGGSPMNTAVAIARQGYDAAIISPVSTDGFGDMIMQHLRTSNVDTSHIAFTNSPTSLAFATLDFMGQAKYTFYIDGCSQGTWGHEELHDNIEEGDILTASGSFALSSENMSEYFDALFEYARLAHGGHTIIFDPNVRTAVLRDSPQRSIENFDRWVKQATIVKASDEDVAWRYPEQTPEDIAREWVVNHGVPLVVITKGDKGAFACTSQTSVSRSAPLTNVVDTVGAGDSFNAGLVTWLIDNNCHTRESIESLTKDQLTQALDRAIELSSDTCRREGADSTYADVG